MSDGGSPTERMQLVLASRPRLAPEVRLVPQVHRGSTWYLLAAPAGDAHWLLDRPAFEFVVALDGERTVAEILDAADVDADDALALLASLVEADALAGDLARGPLAVLEATREKERRTRLRMLQMPLSIRLPLFDPDPLLRALQPLAQLLFSRFGLLCWALVIVAGGIVALREAPAIGLHFATRFLDPGNLVLLWLVYPVLKGFHELGHGLAARRYGAAVHELGVMLLVFVPVPYVDASGTSALRSARHRMAVAGAGIAAELLFSALAILAWSAAAPGLLRDLLFDVAVIGGVSTLLFNGNPLLRFDGYYVLSDALEIPNLGPRAQRQLGHLFRRWVVGIEEAAPDVAPGEGRWLVVYGLASGVYRLIVGVGIALFVGGRYFFVGAVLAILFVAQQILAPAVRGALRLVPQAREAGQLPRLGMVAGVLVLAGALLLFGVPVTRTTVADAILAPPEHSIVRAGTAGFVAADALPTGAEVAAGAVLVRLDNAELRYDATRLEARLVELRSLRGIALGEDRVEVQRLDDEMLAAAAELERVRADLERLQARAPVAGRVSWSTRLAPGRFVERGDVLGFVTGADDWRLRTVLDQRGMGLLGEGLERIDVISRSAPGHTDRGELFAQTPMAVDVLPDRTLGTLGGGVIPVDQRDPEGLALLTPMFEVEVRLPEGAEAEYRVGQRFLVRFVHPSSPLGPRLGERLGALLRARLDEPEA